MAETQRTRTETSPPLATTTVVQPRAIISWSAILAGALTAIAVLIVLSVTALASGLQVAPVGDAGDPRFGPAVASIITGLFIIIAFGAGGLTAVWAAGIVEPGPAILNGFLVWTLALLLVLALAAFGLGGLGAISDIFGPAFEATTVDAFRRAGWAAVTALALGAGSAVLGGLLATREEISRVW